MKRIRVVLTIIACLWAVSLAVTLPGCRKKDKPPLHSNWFIQRVTAEGFAGHTSIDIDSSGYPHICYSEENNGDLKYARWDGSAWQVETVDSSDDVGYDCSIAIDSNDRPHISYSDQTNTALKYARWDGTAWQIETVDSPDVGSYTSIALDTNDHPHISYGDWGNSSLKYAHHDGSSWQVQSVDSGAAALGMYTSIALDSNDYPHISYCILSSGLKYTSYNGASWGIQTVDSVPMGITGEFSSIALDANDHPRISYYNMGDPVDLREDLMYASYNGTDWDIETADSAGDVGEDGCLALDSNDLPHISYYSYDPVQCVKYAHYNGSSWELDTISVGLGCTSIAVDSNDCPHISYSHQGKLMYAKMRN